MARQPQAFDLLPAVLRKPDDPFIPLTDREDVRPGITDLFDLIWSVVSPFRDNHPLTDGHVMDVDGSVYSELPDADMMDRC